MQRVLAIAAHPDDIEFFMSGTFMLLGRAGWELHYMNLANGCCGTTQYDRATIAEMRRDEARQAAASIGAVFHESVCADLEIFYDKPTLAQVASVVRDAKPDIILTHAPSDYMEDHMNTSRLAVTAAFCRGMPNFPVAPPRDHIPGQVTLYHAQPFSHRDPLNQLVTPDFWVDVSDVVEDKVAMLAHHQSQKRWLDESQGHNSYLQTLRDLDAEGGQLSGKYAFAEGWRKHLHLGLGSPDENPLVDALGSRLTFTQPAS